MNPKLRKRLENLLYRYTSNDFKGRGADGVRRVLNLESAGTCSVPLSAFADDVLIAKLPRKAREAAVLAGLLEPVSS
jgi:hypothetical protein